MNNVLEKFYYERFRADTVLGKSKTYQLYRYKHEIAMDLIQNSIMGGQHNLLEEFEALEREMMDCVGALMFAEGWRMHAMLSIPPTSL